jgi:hypothetical protein
MPRSNTRVHSSGAHLHWHGAAVHFPDIADDLSGTAFG